LKVGTVLSFLFEVIETIFVTGPPADRNDGQPRNWWFWIFAVLIAALAGMFIAGLLS